MDRFGVVDWNLNNFILKIIYFCCVSHPGFVIILGSRLRAGRFRIRIPGVAMEFSLLQNIQTGSEAHLASYSMGSGRGIKRPEREVDHLPLTPRLRMSGAILPATVLVCSRCVEKDNFKFCILCLSLSSNAVFKIPCLKSSLRVQFIILSLRNLCIPVCLGASCLQ
jgi:hypothetical protein